MIEIFIPGVAKPAGSKKGFFNKNLGRVMIVDACKESRPWKAQVSAFAQEAVLRQGLTAPLRGPLAVDFTFTMPRVGTHFGTGKNAGILKDTAPVWHTARPDALKLARGCEDALSGIVYVDDSQIAQERIVKVYGIRPGVRIKVWKIDEQDQDEKIKEVAELFQSV